MKTRINIKQIIVIIISILLVLLLVPLEYTRIGGIAGFNDKYVILGPIFLPFFNSGSPIIAPYPDYMSTNYIIIWEYYIIELLLIIILSVFFCNRFSKRKSD